MVIWVGMHILYVLYIAVVCVVIRRHAYPRCAVMMQCKQGST